jgi:hypothetical protein
MSDRLLLCCLLALLAPLSTAAAQSPKVKYVPPDGFANHRWGELRSSFTRLPQEPIGVAAAYILSQKSADIYSCGTGRYIGPQMNGAYESCDWQKTLDRLGASYQGGGFYILSEYNIPGQGFRWGDESDGVVIHPVVYQFCANWPASIKKKVPPPNFDALNKLCGMRLMFQSESAEELAKLPADHETVYDRMLDKLLAKFGPPAHFSRRGQVIIETHEGEIDAIGESAARKFSVWRWCPPVYNGFHTSCKASVTLSIEPATGQGQVLYSTPLLWEYAWARENNGFKGDRLFKLLHVPR